MTGGEAFREIWAADFEFRAPSGHNPEPICMVAKELISGRTIRLWQDALRAAVAPPFDPGPDTLFVAYYASAEIGCHLALGWDIPANILDLFAEFRNLTNGIPAPCGSGLLGAMGYFGLGGIQALEKDSMRELAMRGDPFTAEERTALLDYCETDVEGLTRLQLKGLLPFLFLVPGQITYCWSPLVPSALPVSACCEPSCAVGLRSSSVAGRVRGRPRCWPRCSRWPTRRSAWSWSRTPRAVAGPPPLRVARGPAAQPRRCGRGDRPGVGPTSAADAARPAGRRRYEVVKSSTCWPRSTPGTRVAAGRSTRTPPPTSRPGSRRWRWRRASAERRRTASSPPPSTSWVHLGIDPGGRRRLREVGAPGGPRGRVVTIASARPPSTSTAGHVPVPAPTGSGRLLEDP